MGKFLSDPARCKATQISQQLRIVELVGEASEVGAELEGVSAAEPGQSRRGEQQHVYLRPRDHGSDHRDACRATDAADGGTCQSADARVLSVDAAQSLRLTATAVIVWWPQAQVAALLARNAEFESRPSWFDLFQPPAGTLKLLDDTLRARPPDTEPRGKKKKVA